METAEQKEELRILVTKLYEECGLYLELLYPKILVRVLPKEQKYHGIILPDGNKQNKPVLEGIVIQTYKSFYQKIYLTQAHWVKDDPDPEARYTQLVECQVKPGDHILFPYIEYGIVPIEPLDHGKGDYRLMPDNLVQAKLDYSSKTLRSELMEMISNSPVNIEAQADFLLEWADFVPKGQVSKTRSGR